MSDKDTRLAATVFDHSFAAAPGFPPVELVVQGFSVDLFGAVEAQIDAQGDLLSLWELFRWLRAHVELDADRPEAAFVGFINSVTVHTGRAAYTATLSRVFNKVYVVYSEIAGGTQTTPQKTTAASDTESQAIYGIKEGIATLNDSTAEAAEAYRDSLITGDAAQSWPRLDPEQGSMDSTPAAEITLRGYWDTLALWRYFGRPPAQEAYDVEPPTVADKQRFGDDTDRAGVAQSFTLTAGEDFNLASVSFYIQKVSPSGGAWPVGNDVVVEVCPDDGAGDPDFMSPIESITFLASDITPQLVKVTVIFSNTNPLSATAPLDYWLVLGHTGADDPDHYYFVGTPEAAGHPGKFRIYDSVAGTWSARVPDADLSFVIGGTIETTTLIAGVVSGVGQFFAGTSILTAGGIYQSAYRNGDDLAGDVIVDLLNVRTAAGERLTARVDKDRYLVVDTTPAFDKDELAFFVGAGGLLYDKAGELVPAHVCPVGQWIGFLDLPDGFEDSSLVKFGPFLAERGEYRVGEGWRVYRADPLDAFSTGMG